VEEYFYECSECGFEGSKEEFHNWINPSLRRDNNDPKCPNCKLYRTAILQVRENV